MAKSGECHQCGTEYERLHQHWSMSGCSAPEGTSSKKTYECATCGDTFEDYPSRRETRGREVFFCSRECKHDFDRGDGADVTCAECGDEFYIPPARVNGPGDYEIQNRFCSKDCESDWKSEHWRGEDHPRWDGGLVETECGECGDTFRVKPAVKDHDRHGQFCSRECAAEAWRVDRVTLTCAVCDDSFEREPWLVRTDQSVCSDECTHVLLSNLHSGEGNPAWAGGPVGYGKGWTKAKREKIRKSQDRLCAGCGIFGPDTGRKLSVHHIRKARSFDDDEERNDDSNLVALCQSCHNRWEGIPLRPDIA